VISPAIAAMSARITTRSIWASRSRARPCISPSFRANALTRYSPGDIYLTTPVGVVGIEVGGGAGAGNTITEGAAGSTYNLYNNCYTHSYGTTDAAQTAGSIWTDADWTMDPPLNAVPLLIASAALIVTILPLLRPGRSHVCPPGAD